jgi:hypothetical protein
MYMYLRVHKQVLPLIYSYFTVSKCYYFYSFSRLSVVAFRHY